MKIKQNENKSMRACAVTRVIKSHTHNIETRGSQSKNKAQNTKTTGKKTTHNIQWTRRGFVVYIVDWHTSRIAVDMTVWIAHLFRFKFL